MTAAEQAKADVAQYARLGFRAGLFAGTSGNLSVCLPDEGIVAITPTGMRYENMQPCDIVLTTLTGDIISGGKPSSELPMHLAIYRGMPQASAVVHTHSPFATAYAAAAATIPCALVEMVFFLGGDVRVAPLCVPGTAELGAKAVEAMQGRTACLLANHGVVTAAAGIARAYLCAEYVEDTARICTLAGQHGGPLSLPQCFIDNLLKK